MFAFAPLSAIRKLYRKIVPFDLRLRVGRALRKPFRFFESLRFAKAYVPVAELEQFSSVIATHQSPLRRHLSTYKPHLQEGKEANVRLASSRIDKILIHPGQ